MRKVMRHAALWSGLGWVVFILQIQFPRTVNFDEFHYVPAARTILSDGGLPNPEHPPLAKWIIAAGMAIGGDTPFGWRIASTVFGALTLGCFFILGYLFLGSIHGAHLTAALTLFNQLLYVQSRIAMLDPIMLGFLSVGFVLIFLAIFEKRNTLATAGVAFGLACACKWSALIPALLCAALYALYQLQFAQQRLRHTLRRVLCYLGALALTYFVVYLPLTGTSLSPFETISRFFELQSGAYQAQQRVGTSHPYGSHWSGWILMLRPIWYAFDREQDGAFVRGVLLIGNPVIMWGGLLALGVALHSAWKRNFKAIALTALFLGQYFCWSIIPRELTFYYYYVPAGMILTLIVAWVLYTKTAIKFQLLTLAAVVGFFLYFWPILSASKIPTASFMQYMWMRSWI